MNTYAKFAILVVAIVGTLLWLAFGGYGESKTYYKTISEVSAMGGRAEGQRIRVGGDVVPGSIKIDGKETRFTIRQDARTLNVLYTGIDPLPDTFKDGSQALADGKLGPDGIFHATKIQAKCASKYEAKPMQRPVPQTNKAAI